MPDLFYEPEPERCLRFGDVITDIPHCICKLEMNKKHAADLCFTYNESVVLTPCCSIARDGLLTVAPLEHINCHWMKNDHFSKDLCVINSPMLPSETIPSKAFEKLDGEQLLKYSGKKPAYTLVDYFIFAPHPLLKTYSAQGKSEIGYYCINFSKVCTLQFRDFKYQNGNSPSPADGIKMLELTDGTRDCLRRKILYFYSRVAE